MASSLIWAVLFLYSGELAQQCQMSCSDSFSRYGYVTFVLLWLLQYIIFCWYWGQRVTSAISNAHHSIIASSHSLHDISILDCFFIVWQPFAAAVALPVCNRSSAALLANTSLLITR